MSERAKELRATRGQIKATVTRAQKYVDKVTESSIDKVHLKLRREELIRKFREFDDVQGEIELIDQSADHEAEREEFENAFYTLVSRIDKFLEPVVSPSPVPSQQTAETVNNNQIRLPKIDLPYFRGAYEEWYPFHDTFVSLIHNNASLSPIQKFHYLRSCLKGDPAEVTRSLEISAINYIEAWNLLKSRYDNKRLIVQTHLKALANLPCIQKEGAIALRQLLDGTLKHTRALTALKRPVAHWDDWLVQLIVSKLDAVTNKEWETKLTPSNLPTFEQLVEFLIHRCQVLEAVSGKSLKALNSNNRQNPHQNVVSHVASKSFMCQICKGNHYIHQCDEFIRMPIKDRIKEAKANKLCLNCLRSTNHYSTTCNSGSCRKCNRKHNTMLHLNSETSQGGSPVAKEHGETRGDTIVSNVSRDSQIETCQQILLSTAIIEILNYQGRPITSRALLDSGSQSCFITHELAQRLNLKQRRFNVPIVGINQTTSQAYYQSLPAVSIDRNSFKIPTNIKLADPTFYECSRIDILLGAEVFYELLCVGQIKATRSHPCLQKSQLGWLVSGRVYNSNTFPTSTVCNVATGDKGLEEMVARFWEIDGNSGGGTHSREARHCEKHFKTTYRRNADGRFVVQLPVTEDKLQMLGNNRSTALKRFYNLERKLSKQPELRREYQKFLKEYEELGHMRLITDCDETPAIKYYIPHHAVIKQNSITTKLRVVFDASCKSETGVSLNDALLVGPNIQDDLFSIISRFRTHPYVITGDVAKMYRQVLVDDSQTSLQRIFWREDERDAINTYELLTVTYGTAPASFLATRCLHEIARLEKGRFPEGAEVIERDFYVDDLLTGANSISAVIDIRDQIINILSKPGFVLRKWAANSAEALKGIPDNSVSEMILNLNKEDDIRTLGIHWNPSSDVFQYFIPKASSCRVTKRTILASVARVFDPLGLIGPVIVTAKILLQRLWQQGLDWDESVPIALHTLWSRYEEQLSMLNQVKVDRHVICKNPIEIEIHGFADASESAYGACVYIVSIDPHGNFFSRLLCAKSRVAPLKLISLPRLELCGTLLLARLINKLNTSLRVPLKRICCWTDSTIALAWIKSPSRTWTTFVANRVSEIQELLPTTFWGHVPSAQNPADIISRGATPVELVNLTLWWEGPTTFIKNSVIIVPEIAFDELPERRSTPLTCAVTTRDINARSREYSSFIFNKFSSFTRLIRVIAYCIRFMRNSSDAHNRNTGPLTVSELERSKTRLVKLAQANAFENEIMTLSKQADVALKGNLANLNPFIDEEGILRVGGRLQNARLHYDSKHPILLPKSHPLTSLIIDHEHRKNFHAGPQLTLAAVRANYWPISGRSAVRLITNRCVICFKNAPVNSRYLMGSLPESRVTPSRPFANTGIDYCGPFLVKEGRRRNAKFVKSYGAIFVCMATKAVHIELVTDMSTDCFIACLKRFMARRGKPANIYSDNGSNFVEANRVLGELRMQVFDDVARNKISELLSIEGVNWHYIPPGAPNFGGLWEAAVKSAKTHLRRVVGNASLTFEELCTILAQIEAILNSRPLIPLSTDPRDLNALTPAHFLIGSSLLSVAEPDLAEVPINRLSRLQHIERLQQHFWQRWSKEYLNLLHQRPKAGLKTRHPLQEGSLVVIRDDNLPPLRWLLGRVETSIPGKDGVVRTAIVRTAKGTIKRPSTKLCVLPIEP